MSLFILRHACVCMPSEFRYKCTGWQLCNHAVPMHAMYTHACAYLSNCLHMHVFICTYVQIRMLMSVCLFKYASMCLPVCLSVYLPVYVSVCLSMSMYLLVVWKTSAPPTKHKNCRHLQAALLASLPQTQ